MQHYKSILDSYREEGRLRAFPTMAAGDEGLIDLTSNDYLGMGSNPDNTQYQEILASGLPFTSSASRLLALNQKAYYELESLLTTLYGKPALLFNSGYHANTGIIPALATGDTLVFSDKLVHASIIDGIRLSKCTCHRFRHNDIDNLRRLIEKNLTPGQRALVVTESVFSMDGDTAPLKELVALKQEYPEIILYVDEAHGFGIRGEKGLGLAEELDLIPQIDILIGTFGKAAASIGAFCVTSPLLVQYLINSARSLIFSTSLPPVNIEWTRRNILRLIKMKKERKRLKQMSARFAKEISGLDNHTTPIIPYIIGDAYKAVSFSQTLRKEGILALPIRRPTIPAGTERIRFSLSAALTDEEIDKVINSIHRHSKLY